MDVLTDLFDDDVAAARRRTVATHLVQRDARLDDGQRQQVKALLTGDYSINDVTALGPVLQLPTDYLRDAETTRMVDHQITLSLLEKATRLCGIGKFLICRGHRSNSPGVDLETQILLRQIREHRLLLSPPFIDIIDEHNGIAAGAVRLDPRSVSVAWLCTAEPPAPTRPQPIDSDLGSPSEDRQADSEGPPLHSRRTSTSAGSRWLRWFTKR